MPDLSKNNHKFFLIVTTIIVGMCSIVYELLISTTASYFLGNSIRQFSIIIGVYMASMGLGSWLSRWIHNELMFYFVTVEIILGLVGAFAVPLCYFYFAYSDYEGFNIFVLLIISVIGMLTGLEIPILTRIMENSESLKTNISTILTFDYLGALVATILFPFFLVPFVGLYKSSLIFGLINVVTGLITYLYYKSNISLNYRIKFMVILGLITSLMIGGALFYAKDVISKWNGQIFKYDVVYEEESPYQNIILTDNKIDFRMYLNGAIQFSSVDEYRYHEALVHVPMNQLPSVSEVLLLGGGEGLAVREILKYKEVEKVTLVDIDPAITKLSATMPKMRQLNQDALSDSRVNINNEDAFRYLLESDETYDVIICDLPDPTNETLSRLYSNAFYKLIRSKLSPNGVMVTQATSPELTPNAFYCIEKTMLDAGFKYTYPYQINVPSFGNWGFILGSNHQALNKIFRKDIALKYLEDESYEHMLYFPKDKRDVEVLPNNLDQPILLEYYIDHWNSLQGGER